MNLQICFMNETASDNESPSSDSESCPKLSKSSSFASAGSNHSRYSMGHSSHPYNARPLSVKKSQSHEKGNTSSINRQYICLTYIFATPRIRKTPPYQNSTAQHAHTAHYIHLFLVSSFPISAVRPPTQSNGQNHIDEDPKEIDFFTKQARLQIEARMALAQAKDMAHMQMEVGGGGWLVGFPFSPKLLMPDVEDRRNSVEF